MSTKLYVGNLSYSVSNGDLEGLFKPYGRVESANVITDRSTGQSKGFGFVEMSSTQEAKASITALHGKEFDGRNLTVNEARPRVESTGGAFGSGDRRGGFGGGRRF